MNHEQYHLQNGKKKFFLNSYIRYRGHFSEWEKLYGLERKKKSIGEVSLLNNGKKKTHTHHSSMVCNARVFQEYWGCTSKKHREENESYRYDLTTSSETPSRQSTIFAVRFSHLLYFVLLCVLINVFYFLFKVSDGYKRLKTTTIQKGQNS